MQGTVDAMDKVTFSKVVKDHLLPMFAGASIGDSTEAISQKLTVAWGKNQTKIRLRPNTEVNWCIALGRSQPFALDDMSVVKCFVEVLGDFHPWHKGSIVSSLFPYSIATVVARSVGSPDQWTTITGILDQYQSWSEQTYEGRRISVSVGVEASSIQQPSGPSIFDVYTKDFGSVLSNGMDTLLVCSKDGCLIRHEPLDAASRDDAPFAPVRYLPLATWSKRHGICIALNRNGEILAFKDGNLRFAKRRGGWRHFTHEPTVRRMSCKRTRMWSSELRKAIYETCLDVSFGRSGGCIAVSYSDLRKCDLTELREAVDQANQKCPEKAQYMKTLLHKPFQEIDRRVRQEIAGIDGATILDSDGRLLSIGAIINISAGSEGGARLAATKQLAKCGMAVKISADGAITGYANINQRGVEKWFEVG